MNDVILQNSHFNSKDTVSLARQLLGKHLVVASSNGGEPIALPITEAEAYDGPKDLACHASKGKTKRTEVMFGSAGAWYVYLIYGMYEMLNLVTGPVDYPAAILIRGVVGISGPGRLTKRLEIGRDLNGRMAAPSNGLHLEDRGLSFDDAQVDITPRIGVAYAKEWASKPYRFVVKKEVEAELTSSLA